MPRTPAPLPTGLADVFTVADALEAGASRRRLRAADLETPFRGIRRRKPDPQTSVETDRDETASAREARRLRPRILQGARDYALTMPDGAAFSHGTAAVICGLPLPLRVMRQVGRRLDVAVLGDRRGSKTADIRGHQLRASMTRTRTHEGLRVTTPATTWALLAAVLTVDELIELADAVVYVPRRRGMERGDPHDALGSLDELEDVMDAGRRIGIAKLRKALPAVRVGAASTGETRMRLACVRAGLPEPELDVNVFAADGSPIGFTELAYPRYRVLIEYEGDHHRTDRSQWNRDIDKHAACVEAGWDPVRVTAQSARRGAVVAVGRIRAALVRGGWTPTT